MSAVKNTKTALRNDWQVEKHRLHVKRHEKQRSEMTLTFSKLSQWHSSKRELSRLKMAGTLSSEENCWNWQEAAVLKRTVETALATGRVLKELLTHQRTGNLQLKWKTIVKNSLEPSKAEKTSWRATELTNFGFQNRKFPKRTVLRQRRKELQRKRRKKALTQEKNV